MNRITVVAIGPDAAELLTLAAVDVLANADAILLRTGRHGVAAWLSEKEIAFDTLDALYDGADDFDMLNEKAAEAVLAAAAGGKAFCYAVPDPASDETVALLQAKGAIARVIAGVSQSGLARADALTTALPAGEGMLTVPAANFGSVLIDPARPLVITEINSRLQAGEVKLRLLDVYAPETRVLLDGKVVALDEMDHGQTLSHLSSVYIPQSPMTERTRYTFGDLLEVMQRLRRPEDGCPWDIEQTHESLRQYVIEEAYEVVEAIDQGDMEKVADELGDVMLQVVFHAQVAKEHGEFDITDVTTAISHKMITRHAHIFGDIVCETSEDVLRSWEAIKKKEKGLRAQADVMRDVPGHLPALMRASKVQNKAKQVGFDWDNPSDALAKVREEADEVQAELAKGADPQEELGDLLFATVNAARLCGVQPELALSAATEKFIRRFDQMEQAIQAEGKTLQGMTLAEMDEYWDAVKRMERKQS